MSLPPQQMSAATILTGGELSRSGSHTADTFRCALAGLERSEVKCILETQFWEQKGLSNHLFMSLLNREMSLTYKLTLDSQNSVGVGLGSAQLT